MPVEPHSPARTRPAEVPQAAETSHPPPARDKRLPELDGIRGIAILAVLISHIQQGLFPPSLFAAVHLARLGKALDGLLQTGWMGVDIFFVLSGFLITGIILRAPARQPFFKGFYIRRAARILPVFLIVFVVVALAIPRLPPWVYSVYLFFLANWLILSPFDVPALGNIWSLAIEEQFYLFWPVIVRNIGKQTLLRVALALGTLSILLRVALALAHVFVFTIYKITPTRLDGLCAGAALAVSMQLPAPRRFLETHWRNLAGAGAAIWILGFLVLKGSLYAFDPRALVLGSCSVELVTCMLIFASLQSALPPRLRRVLSGLRLGWFGRRSYALYLIHSPLLFLTELWLRKHLTLTFATALAATFAVVVVTLAVAELSWQLLEARSIRFGHQLTHTSDATAVRALSR